MEALLGSIRASYDGIRRGDDSAIPAYNYGVSRLVEALETSGADPWSHPLPLADSGGVTCLRGRAPADISPVHDKLIPTDTLQFHGKQAGHRAIVEGIGAPLVLVTTFEGLGHEVVRKNLPLRNLTALVTFEESTATLTLVDPYQVEAFAVAGRSRRLSADYGAAIMLALSKARIDKLGLARLLRPSRYDDTAHLNFLQPYDRQRIPVLMVHGLQTLRRPSRRCILTCCKILKSGPHRGSILASNWVGSISSRLVRLLGFVADVRNSVLSAATCGRRRPRHATGPLQHRHPLTGQSLHAGNQPDPRHRADSLPFDHG
jgi:hypothetical protein